MKRLLTVAMTVFSDALCGINVLREQLDVLYLGTDPPTQAVAPALETKELDYEAIDAEHQQLLQVYINSDIMMTIRFPVELNYVAIDAENKATSAGTKQPSYCDEKSVLLYYLTD